MMEKFEKYWRVCHIVMALVVVLHPRYKMMIMEYYFSIIYGCESEREIDKVWETCYDMLKEYQMKLKSNEEVGSSGASSSKGHSKVTVEERDQLSKFDMFVTHRTSKIIHVKSELDHYLEDSVVPRTPDFDVLSW